MWKKFPVSCVNEHLLEDKIKRNSIESVIPNDGSTKLANSNYVHYNIGDYHFRTSFYQRILFRKNEILKRITALVLVCLTFSMLWEATAFHENIYAISNRGVNGPSSPGASELHPSNTGPASGPSSGIHPSNTGPASGPSSGIHPSNTGPASGPSSGIHPPGEAQTTTISPSTNNCPTAVHPNGADTTVVQPNNCPANPNGHVTVNSGDTSTSTSSPSLTVNNVQSSNSESSTTKQESNKNTIPVANAGSNQKVHQSEHVTLDGTKSYDPSGNPLKFSWLQLASGPVVSLSNENSTKAMFIAPLVTQTTSLIFQLIVNDDEAYSKPSYVTITVES
jgi:hypothetical protein